VRQLAHGVFARTRYYIWTRLARQGRGPPAPLRPAGRLLD